MAEPTTPPPARRQALWLWALAAIVLIGIGILIAVRAFGDDDNPATPTVVTDNPRLTGTDAAPTVPGITDSIPETTPGGPEPDPPGPIQPVHPAEMSLRVVPGKRVSLLERPGGRVVKRIGDTTEFGSPEVLSPTGQSRDGWLAVSHTSLGNDGVAWLRPDRAQVSTRPRPVQLEVDLSRREVTVRPEGRRISVAIGAPDTPTPPGEYYVTDKLPGANFGPSYGCCILALSGHQPNLPQGWSGGDRLAIHGSPTPTWGQNVSNGCLHARETDLRFLLKTVPLGTRVVVRA